MKNSATSFASACHASAHEFMLAGLGNTVSELFWFYPFDQTLCRGSAAVRRYQKEPPSIAQCVDLKQFPKVSLPSSEAVQLLRRSIQKEYFKLTLSFYGFRAWNSAELSSENPLVLFLIQQLLGPKNLLYFPFYSPLRFSIFLLFISCLSSMC